MAETSPSATSGSIRFRPGGPHDAEACAVVHLASAMLAYRDIFPPDTQPPTVADLAAGWMGAAWVAEDDGEVVGAVCIGSDAAVPSGWLLSRLYVHPSRWGSGVGSELLERAVASAWSAGAPAVNLWVLEPNTDARALYERRGWRLVPGPTLANDGTDAVDVLYQLDRP